MRRGRGAPVPGRPPRAPRASVPAHRLNGGQAARAQRGRKRAKQDRRRRHCRRAKQRLGTDVERDRHAARHPRRAVRHEWQRHGVQRDAEREPRRDSHRAQERRLHEHGALELATGRPRRGEQPELTHALGERDAEGPRDERDGHEARHGGDARAREPEGGVEGVDIAQAEGAEEVVVEEVVPTPFADALGGALIAGSGTHAAVLGTLPLLALGLIATLARLRLDSGAADA